MAVIKCKNCENEILDTEIVCPYCDFPTSSSKEQTEVKADDAVPNGETIKIPKVTPEDIKASPEHTEPTGQEKVLAEESGAPIFENVQESTKEEPPKEELSKEQTEEPSKKEPSFADGETVKIPAGQIHSDTLRRSLEERKAQRMQENSGKKDRKKIAILAITIIGIFVIIYLIISVFSNIMGEGLFDKEKENKKAKKEVTSSAEMKELGFDFHSQTLKIIDEEIIAQDYRAGDKKPWKDYGNEVSYLTISDGIESVCAHAFDDLDGLVHVTIPPSLERIGDSAFYGCRDLEKIAFDSSDSLLESIGNYAFTDCSSLESIVFGDSLVTIGEGAFKSCKNLEKITIPKSVEEIGADAFLGCHKLVIECYKDTPAHEYAIQNGIPVELLDSDEEEQEKQEEQSAPTPSTPAPVQPTPPPQPEKTPEKAEQTESAQQVSKEEKLAELDRQFREAMKSGDQSKIDEIALEIEKVSAQ